MHYQLWDLKSGNLLAEYDTEEEALATVRAALEDDWDPEDLGVGQEWDDGEEGDDADLAPPLYGSELVARVMTADPEQRRRSA